MKKIHGGNHRPLTKRSILSTKVTRLGGIKKITAKMIIISTGATLHSLIYGIEAMLPIKVEISSMRMLAESKLEEIEWTI